MGQRTLVAGCTLLVVLGLSRPGASEPDPKDPQRGWVDYDDLKQADRLPDRPGNFPALGAVADFFADRYAVRPDYSRCAFPLQLDAQVYQTRADVDKALDAEAAGRRPRNKARQYNLQLRSVTLHGAAAFADSGEFKRLPDRLRKRFGEVRKRHPGRAVVALVVADFESLQSPKVEEGDEPIVLYLVPAGGRWRVAWANGAEF